MAEEGTSSESWWGGWLQTAKEKSSMALDFVRKDLVEFSSTMQTDATQAASTVKEKLTQETATEATKKMKEGVSSLLGGISKALTVEAEDLHATKPASSSQHVFDRAKARLHAVQIDPGTYCDNPDGPIEDYNKWRSTFQLEQHKGDISELLVSNAEVRSLYTQLVPSQVSHSDYWHRYFYKVHQLELDQARKAALMKRADVGVDQADLEWDDDEWGDLEVPPSPSHRETESETAKDVQRVTVDTSSPLQPELRQSQVSEDNPTTEHSGLINVEQNSCHMDTKTSNHLPTQTETDSHSGMIPLKTTLDVSRTDNTLDSAGIKEQNEECTPPPPPGEEQGKEDVALTAVEDVALVAVEDVALTTVEEGGAKSEDVGRRTPSSDSSNSKELSSIDDDWEKDFDIEVSEEDIRLAQETAKKIVTKEVRPEAEEDDDWENWD